MSDDAVVVPETSPTLPMGMVKKPLVIPVSGWSSSKRSVPPVCES